MVWVLATIVKGSGSSNLYHWKRFSFWQCVLLENV